MAPSKQEFSVSGPRHLTSVHWDNACQRRAVMASLVKAVSVMEKDRVAGRCGSLAWAPHWWKFFGFELQSKIVLDDGIIIGAVYRFGSSPGNGSNQNGPPSYVVAFRGTIPKPMKGKMSTVAMSMHTTVRDFWDDFRCLIHKLHRSSRFKIGMETVSNLVDRFGAPRIWLAGHSLGSANAMLIGKEMARSGSLLETYLFNPPFISWPIEQIVPRGVSDGIRIIRGLTKVGVAAALNLINDRPMESSSFMALTGWAPHIFVSPHDFICSSYIGYFQHRANMEAIGFGGLARISSQNSYASLISDQECQSLDALPSARLIINRKRYTSLRAAHKLRAWWLPDVQCESSEYRLQS